MKDQKVKDIMLAEDDKDDVYIFETALAELNIPFDLRHAENGDALFILLKKKIPYILFLDIHMPCKDGLACIMEIRKNPEYDKMPVVIYTSFSKDEYVEQTYRSGANIYLAKPNGFLELIEKLKKIFSLNWEEYLHFPSRESFMLT